MNLSILNFEFFLTGVLLIGGLSFLIKKLLVLIKKVRSLKLKLEEKNKAITSYSLNMIQKNELIATLSERIESIKKVSQPETIREFNSIKRTLEESQRVDKDWENFRVSFEAIHEGFIEALRCIHPDLSSTEQKLCALIRLNLNLKETANVLGISPDSVKTARHRLKKKLNIDKNIGLATFMAHIQTQIAA